MIKFFFFSKNRWKYIKIAMEFSVSPQFVCEVAHGLHSELFVTDEVLHRLVEMGILQKRSK